MKNILALFMVCSLMILSACGDKNKNAPEEAEVVTGKSEVSANDLKTDRIKDCDDFLERYEDWANTLMDLIEEHKDDPISLVTSPEYTKTMAASTTFMQDWQTISVSCAANPYYEKRMDEIQENIKKRNDELGL